MYLEKNIKLLVYINVVVKWSPLDIHLCERFFQFLKHYSNSIFRIAFRSFSAALLMSSIHVKRRSLRFSLLLNRKFRNKKSHTEPCLANMETGTFCFGKNSHTSSEMWAGAFCNHTFHIQNIRKNVMIWANRYPFMSDFSDCDSVISFEKRTSQSS